MAKSGDSKKNREKEIVIKYERGKNQQILINIGIAIAFSFAGFMLSQIRSKALPQSIAPSLEIVEDGDDEINEVETQNQSEYKNSSSSKMTINCTTSNDATSSLVSLSPSSSGDEEGFLLPEFNDLILQTLNPNSNLKNPTQIHSPNNQMDKEISFLKNLVSSLEEREKSLELQLLKIQGLKQQEISVRELQNQVKVNNVETKFYTLKIESLLSENHNLRAKLSDYDDILSELYEAREQVRVLKEMERISTEEDQRLNEMERIEEELRDSRRIVAKLEEEKLELVHKLELQEMVPVPVRIDVSSVHTSKEAEVNYLRQEIETLTKQIEQLKIDRCTDLEELVYLKWINACLRYELRDYSSGTNKTLAKDLSTTLSPKSEQIAKQLILDYAYNSSPDELDFNFNWEYSSQLSKSENRDSISNKKIKLLGKLRNLILGKDKGESSFRVNNSSCEESISERKSYDSNSSCLTEDLMVLNQMDNKIERCRSDFGVSYRNKGVVPLEGDLSLIGCPGNGIRENEIPEKTRLKKLADALKLSGGRSKGKLDNRRTVSFSFST